MTDEPKVLGEPQAGVAPATPGEGGVAPATPTPAPNDAEERLKKIESDYQAAVSRATALEMDVRNLKSTFDRKTAESQRSWKEREQGYQREIDELKLRTLPDEQREAYKADIISRRDRDMQETVAQAQRSAEEAQNMLFTYNYFIERGVPANRLTTDQGYDELWKAGLSYLDEELKRLRQATSAAPAAPIAPAPAQLPPQAPPVSTATTAPAFTGGGWPELIQKYGDMDTVYRLVETGQLPPSIIPVRKE